MPEDKDDVRSTFPIPRSSLWGRKLRAIFSTPLTWAAYLPAVGAFSFLDVGPLVFSGLLVAVTGGIFAYWKTQSSALERKVIEQLIKESNEQQDKHLVTKVRELYEKGFTDYSSTLANFLHRKQQIESALQENGIALQSKVEEVESLTDAVVFGVEDQIHRLVKLDERESDSSTPLSAEAKKNIATAKDEISERVEQAWEVLDKTWLNLQELLNPAADIEGYDTSHTSLDNAIDRLKQEQEIAKKVNRRMTQEWQTAFETDPLGSTTTDLESELE